MPKFNPFPTFFKDQFLQLPSPGGGRGLRGGDEKLQRRDFHKYSITKRHSDKYTFIMSEYPEIITELIKRAESDEIRHFNLSSFMSGKSLEDVFGKIDKAMEFFSVYAFMEPLEDDLWEDNRYAEKEKVLLCSRVEEEARKYWWDRNREHLELIDERVESLKKDPAYKDMKGEDLRDRKVD